MRPKKLSRTAAFIAIKFYALTRETQYRSMFNEQTVRYYEKLVWQLPSPLGYYYSLLTKKWFRGLFTTSDELLLPGDLMHILMRKYLVPKKIDRVLNSEGAQLLVLGSGFDHLSILYSERGIPSVELDTPEMSLFKQQFAEKEGFLNSNLNFQRAFITRDRIKDLLPVTPGLDKSRPVVVVTEGFFDYLDRRHMVEILDDLRSFFKNDIYLISTIFDLDELSLHRRLIFRSGVRIVGERIKLNLSNEEFLHVLKLNGFEILEIESAREMETRILEPLSVSLPILKGFYLVSAASSSSG